MKIKKDLTLPSEVNKQPPKGILMKSGQRSNFASKKSTDKPVIEKKAKRFVKKPNTKNAFTKVDDTPFKNLQNMKIPLKKLPNKGRGFERGKEGVFTKKERRLARLNAKKHSDIVPGLLSDWEILRREETETDTKHSLIEKMIATAKTKLVDLCKARDTSRIVESMIQLGTESQRWIIFAELKDRLRYLTMSQYAKHVVLKLINYGAKEHRLEMFKMFRGHVAKMLRHKHAAEVIELLYNDYATASQRALILQETYGHQYALQLTANNVQRLEEAIDLNPDKRQTILANLNDLLVTMVSKGLMRLSIVQHLLLEYLTVLLKSSDVLKLQTPTTIAKASQKLVRDCTDDDDGGGNDTNAPGKSSNENSLEDGTRREDRLEVLVETILEAGVAAMLHTREGVKAALAVLWICPPKDRKILVKSLKTCIASTAENEHGHIFIMGLLDAIDDHKLMTKTVIKELLDDIKEVVAHPHARKVLLYALAPRDQRHIAPALLQACLAPGDDSPFTKKPLAARALELRAPQVGLLPGLLQLVVDEESLIPLFIGSAANPDALEDRSRIVLLAEILIRSSAYELQFSTAANQFKRTGSKEEERLSVTRSREISILTAEDLEELAHLRTAALRNFVTLVLAQPNFRPVGLKSTSSGSTLSVDSRRHLQTQRRKRALSIAESGSIKRRKVTVKAFKNTDDDDENDPAEGSAEPMDTSSLPEDSEQPADAPFLERAEGQLLVSRILQSEKKSASHDLGRLVMELVPEQTLRAWLTCNRSCFTLVHLYELGDEAICSRLKKILSEKKAMITASPLPGAKVLAKHLFAQ